MRQRLQSGWDDPVSALLGRPIARLFCDSTVSKRRRGRERLAGRLDAARATNADRVLSRRSRLLSRSTALGVLWDRIRRAKAAVLGEFGLGLVLLIGPFLLVKYGVLLWLGILAVVVAILQTRKRIFLPLRYQNERCRNCDYDLHGIGADDNDRLLRLSPRYCPECGKEWPLFN